MKVHRAPMRDELLFLICRIAIVRDKIQSLYSHIAAMQGDIIIVVRRIFMVRDLARWNFCCKFAPNFYHYEQRDYAAGGCDWARCAVLRREGVQDAVPRAAGVRHGDGASAVCAAGAGGGGDGRGGDGRVAALGRCRCGGRSGGFLQAGGRGAGGLGRFHACDVGYVVRGVHVGLRTADGRRPAVLHVAAHRRGSLALRLRKRAECLPSVPRPLRLHAARASPATAAT